MNWLQLLSLKRFGDTQKRLRLEQDETRLGFEVDFDRVIFADSFRSLQDKTQVVPLSNTDFVHTRLTHSLEVSVVARSLGRLVGKELLAKYPELVENGYKINDFGSIVAAAALAHDIGNPPFGHSGEKAIGAYFNSGNGKKYQEELTAKEWQDLVDFEGNANGFKIVSETRKGVNGGLRLSYATLGAFIKYPKESLPKKPTKHIVDKKYGFFQQDKTTFLDVVKDLGLTKLRDDNDIAYYRHPLTYLVEAADDICYTIIDFEDGINLGLVEEAYALEYMVKLVKGSLRKETYHALTTKEDRISYLRALAINVLVKETVETFLKYEKDILNGSFSSALLKHSSYKAQIEDILMISREKIYQSKEVIEKEITGYKVIQNLLDVVATAFVNKLAFAESNYDKLILKLVPEKYYNSIESQYQALLQASCYVASLSDSSAILLHKKINGLGF